MLLFDIVSLSSCDRWISVPILEILWIILRRFLLLLLYIYRRLRYGEPIKWSHETYLIRKKCTFCLLFESLFLLFLPFYRAFICYNIETGRYFGYDATNYLYIVPFAGCSEVVRNDMFLKSRHPVWIVHSRIPKTLLFIFTLNNNFIHCTLNYLIWT